jgi:branched-chain amino acid transport system substrate-binding protein
MTSSPTMNAISRRSMIAGGVSLVGGGGLLSACGSPAGDIAAANVGITDDTVVLGQTWPTSGAAAAVYGPMLEAERAWIRHVNEDLGGVPMRDGRTRRIELRTLDDGLDPSRAVQNARQLVERDGVFAIISPAGTANSGAVATYTERMGVPLLYVVSGAEHWTDVTKHRWSVALQPPGALEGRMWARWLNQNRPNAKVGLLRDNTDFGHDLERGLAEEITRLGSSVRLVETQGFQPIDTTLTSQLTNLRASGADVFFNGAPPQFAALGYKALVRSGWSPEVNILTNASSDFRNVIAPAGAEALQGVLCFIYLKDPTDVQWVNDPDVVHWNAVLDRYAPRLPRTMLTFWAPSLVQATIETLKAAEAPTRAAVMNAAHRLDAALPALAPGIRVHNTPETNMPVSQFAMAELRGSSFVLTADAG